MDQGDGSEKWSDSGYTLKQVLIRFIDGLNVILESKTERKQENLKNFWLRQLVERDRGGKLSGNERVSSGVKFQNVGLKYHVE